MRLDRATLLVLAGGAGRRLGRGDKCQVPVAGRPMIAWVLDLAPRFAEVRLVAPATMDRTGLGVAVIADAGRGAPAALAAGLAAVPTEWAVALACDLPRVDPAVLAHLADAAGDTVDAVVPEAGGRVHPLHAVYRASVAGVAQEVADAQGRLRDVLDRVRTRRLPLAGPATASVTNVNTPADLAAAEAALRARD